MAPLISTPADLAALPDGTVVSPTTDCRWPHRYAGRRFRKRGISIDSLDPDPYTRATETALIALFRDPLPAEVVGFEEVKVADLALAVPESGQNQE